MATLQSIMSSLAQLLATCPIKTLEVMAYWPRAKLGPLHRISRHPRSGDGYIFLLTVNVDRTMDKELEMLATGHNEEEHGREELPVDIL